MSFTILGWDFPMHWLPCGGEESVSRGNADSVASSNAPANVESAKYSARSRLERKIEYRLKYPIGKRNNKEEAPTAPADGGNGEFLKKNGKVYRNTNYGWFNRQPSWVPAERVRSPDLNLQTEFAQAACPTSCY